MLNNPFDSSLVVPNSSLFSPQNIGPMVIESLERIFNRPIEIMGDQRQYIHGNWKLYAENTRDPYHASLLHLFHNTFGLYRSTQTGACSMDESHRHTMLYAKAATSDAAVDAQRQAEPRGVDRVDHLVEPVRVVAHHVQTRSEDLLFQEVQAADLEGPNKRD